MIESSADALLAAAAQRRAETAYQLGELEWLLDGGVPARDACERVGWTLHTAARAAYRHGHPIASRLNRAAESGL